MPTTEHAVAPTLDFHTVRDQFPSLAQTVNGYPAAFLDGPGGTHFGGRLGVGAAYWLSDMWAVGAGASYNLIVTDKKKGFEQSSLQYVGLTGQLTLKIPSGARK